MRVDAAPAAHRRRAGLGCGAAFAIGLAVFLVISSVAGAIFVLAPDGSNVSASFIHAQPGSLRWNMRDRLTILLLGVDDHTSKAPRAEALILASFDPSTRSATLLSIPPQLWVTIPGFGQGRLGEAYGDGGPRLALYTTESVTETVIPYYAVVDFAALRSLIDALGGVRLTVTRSLAASSGTSGSQGHERVIYAGPQQMDGQTALDYFRIPRTSAALDTDLMNRQQQLLLAIGATSLQPQTAFRIPMLINSFSSQIPTNLPYDQIPALTHLLARAGGARVDQAVLGDGDGAVMQYGSSILVANWQRIASESHRLIPGSLPTSGSPVAVMNGSGVLGQASGLADWLRQAGFRVPRIASASSFGYSRTEVLLSPQAGPQARTVANAASALLQVPVVRDAAETKSSPVVVIIGHDYQDPTQN